MRHINLYTETGEPKRVRCYMYKRNPKPFADWITVVYTHANRAGYPIGTTVYRTMSEDPSHPQGVGLWGEQREPLRAGGSRVKFSELPEKCRVLVMQDYKELWECA